MAALQNLKHMEQPDWNVKTLVLCLDPFYSAVRRFSAVFGFLRYLSSWRLYNIHVEDNEVTLAPVGNSRLFSAFSPGAVLESSSIPESHYI